MSLTKEEVLSEGMIDERLIAKFPVESERRAAINRAWSEVHPDASLQGEERTLEMRGTIHKTENGEAEVVDGEVLGFNKAFAEESAPMRAEIQKLKKLLNDLIAVVAIIGDKTISKETVNKKSRNIRINPKLLHIKDFISPKTEGEINEV